MSVNLTDNAILSFGADVKDAYQATGILRKKVRVVTGITGTSHRFHKIGKGLAVARIPQTEVIPMGIGHTNATATLADWHAAEYTDLFDDQKVNYSERSFLASTAGRAISRREDQIIQDAIAASGTDLTIAKTIGTTHELNLAKVRKAKQLLDNNNVPSGDRHIVCNPEGLEQMLGDSTNTSSDFSNIKRLQDGEMGGTPWLGFEWEIMGNRDEGGISQSGDDVTCHAWHMPAIGLAIGKDLEVQVNYVPQYTSTLTNAIFIGGATTIDAEGVVDITYDETTVV